MTDKPRTRRPGFLIRRRELRGPPWEIQDHATGLADGQFATRQNQQPVRTPNVISLDFQSTCRFMVLNSSPRGHHVLREGSEEYELQCKNCYRIFTASRPPARVNCETCGSPDVVKW